MKLSILILLLSGLLYGQTTIYPLYEGTPPCATDRSLATEYKDDIGLIVTDVSSPEVHHYAPIPRAANGSAVLIVPGGGYWIEAWDLEGVDIANHLTAAGFHAFVLRHRLPAREEGECKSHVALDDAQRGMQLVRILADSLGYEPNQIGIMGFSAGGHLAGSASVHNITTDAVSSRPDFSVLVYPVLIMNAERAGHGGSQQGLLGAEPDPELLDYYNIPAQVDSLTPPALLVHASDDGAVAPANSLRYYEALVAEGVPADLRIYATGGHGFGAAQNFDSPVKGWLGSAIEWMMGVTRQE